ncbi:hypothetical protein GCM10028820_17590 [Tessaracoccus terricola]
MASPSPSVTTRASTPSRSYTRQASPSPDATLPGDFPVEGELVDHAAEVVAELHRVASELPALKLDVTADQATLTVVDGEDQVHTYRWRDGVVSVADSDVQNLGQASFNPTTFPLHDLRRIFDVAALHATSSENQVLQVVEYRGGEVYMTVTTRPESRTVFFHRDGTVVKELDTHSVADITAGLKAVTGSTQVVLAVGFSVADGYWADVPKGEGVIERRIRIGSLPTFSAQRSETLGLEPFDPLLLDPAAITMAIAEFREDPEQECSVTVDNRYERTQPVVRYDCGGDIFHTDMRGRDMSAQFS